MLLPAILLVFLVLYLGLLRIDWTPGRYRIGFAEGPELGLKTRLTPGVLTLSETGLQIAGPQQIEVPFTAIRDLKVGPFQGARRVFRLSYEGGELSIIVVRFMVGGWFFVGDFFKARRLEAVLPQTF